MVVVVVVAAGVEGAAEKAEKSPVHKEKQKFKTYRKEKEKHRNKPEKQKSIKHMKLRK